MGNYPYLVNIAWDIITKFIEDWQGNPNLWVSERDFQAEIANRLRFAYNTIGNGTIKAKYNDALPSFNGIQKWSRVMCEPQIWYNNKKDWCRPDIVVWDDIPDPNQPPDAKYRHNYPILLVCEIKLDLPNGDKENDWDRDKMEHLVNQGDAKYACCLKFIRKPAKSGNGISWNMEKNKVWICTVNLPSSKEDIPTIK